MSADAKVWFEDGEDVAHWKAIHDGDCAVPRSHVGTSYDLRDVLESVESCMGGRLRWVLFQYTDGTLGLKGHLA